MKNGSDFSALLQGFFTQRLLQQKHVSSHTIASYRDTFRMLLQFIHRRLHKAPCRLAFEEVDAPLIAEFLQDLEKSRRSSARTRNLRLTAIRSFFQYAAYEAPAHAAQIQRVLAIPSKRYDRKQVQFLSQPEIKALVETPDTATWSGRRDRLLLLIAIQTGLRLSELSKLARKDLAPGTGAHVRCMGKGRNYGKVAVMQRNRSKMLERPGHCAWRTQHNYRFSKKRRSASPGRKRNRLARGGSTFANACFFIAKLAST
jgi:site-specific recombinase XerD